MTASLLAKAKAARTWIGHANDHAQTYAGKPWPYVLIPHDAVVANASLAGLTAKYAQTSVDNLSAYGFGF
jgi:type III restriction enzyme